MTTTNPIRIDHDQKFPHLEKAPIVEAIIDFRARAVAPWVEDDITSKITSALQDYPGIQNIGSFSLIAQLQPPQDSDPVPSLTATQEDHGWLGVRAESKDGCFVASFTRDGFALSRLAPYEDWNSFLNEALRLWQVYCKLASPHEVLRLGVRFINKLEVPVQDLDFSDYFLGLNEEPEGLGTAHFLNQLLLALPGYPYLVKRVQTFQHDRPNNATLALLLDIDAFCSEPCDVNSRTINERLADLHWLKNHVFFNSFSGKALEKCR